jgi:hypothetical protein
VERRSGHANPRCQSDRSELVAPPQLDDPALHSSRGLGGTPSRVGGTVLEAGETTSAVVAMRTGKATTADVMSPIANKSAAREPTSGRSAWAVSCSEVTVW